MIPEDMPIQQQKDICDIWETFRVAATNGKQDYMRQCRVANQYYTGPHDFVFRGVFDAPVHKVTINLVWELVRLFGPQIYGQDPKRLVEHRMQGQDPGYAPILDNYLNYTPGEFSLKTSARAAAEESLINGRGCLWTEIDQRTGYPVHNWVPTRDILIDPSSKRWHDALFIMRFHSNEPLWRIAERFGQDVAINLWKSKAVHNGDPYTAWTIDHQEHATTKEKRKIVESYSNRHVSWVEVYSKLGVGLRYATTSRQPLTMQRLQKRVLGGDSQNNVWLAYEPTKKVLMDIDRWPIAFWADHGRHSWPCSFYDPADNMEAVWPNNIVRAAEGELRFLDWGWSFAFQQIRKTSRNLNVCDPDLSTLLVAALQNGKSDIVVPLANFNPNNPKGNETQIMHVDLGSVDPQLINLLSEAERLFRHRVGLSEVHYGETKASFRSAEEAALKGEMSRLTMDEYADRAEDWQGDVARKEAIAARLLVTPEMMAPIVGPEMAQAWGFYQQGDLRQMIREFDYHITAGSMRKMSPQVRAEVSDMRMDRFYQTTLAIGDLPTAQRMQDEWERAHGTRHPEKFVLQGLPPTAADEAGAEEEAKARAQAQVAEEQVPGAPADFFQFNEQTGTLEPQQLQGGGAA